MDRISNNIFIILVLLTIYNDGAKNQQSKVCTDAERQKNIQCFQELPNDNYEALKGSSVTMRCIVRNQHGKVQWRAQKILLGYDRNLPAKPRFRVVGSAVNGEHFLEISNVTESDSGDYECQVQPDGEEHPLLRRKTTLTVLVRPSKPQIQYNSIVITNQKFLISSLDKSIRTIFTCVSYNGVPKVRFRWFINNEKVKKLKLLSSLVERVNDDKSKLSVLTRELNDGDVIRCRVRNKATELHHDPDQRNLDVDITVDKQSPPGKPRIVSITGPVDNAYTVGDIIKAKCVAEPVGKPQGSIMWKWLFASSSSSSSNEQLDEDISTSKYEQWIENNKLISTLQIKLKSDYHGGKLLCISYNPIVKYQVVAKKIMIKYPPKTLKMSTSDNSMSYDFINSMGVSQAYIYSNANSFKYITCTTSNFYSEAKINWRIQSMNDAVMSQFNNRPSSSSSSSNTNTPFNFQPIENLWNDGESYRRNSTVRIKITKQMDRSLISCQVWSNKEHLEARAQFNVTYPPDKPIISGYNPSTPVKTNNIIQLICITEGGNPYPDLQWYRRHRQDNEELTSTFPVDRMGSQTSLKIKITPKIADNNAQFYCGVKSRALTNEKGEKQNMFSDSIRLSVLFPPSNGQLIPLSSSTSIQAGQETSFKCVTAESKPRATIQWKLNSCGRSEFDSKRNNLNSSDLINENCERDLSKYAIEKVKPGEFSGSIVESYLNFTVDWKNDMDDLDCLIYNPEYGANSYVLRRRHQLRVTFPPQFQNIEFNGRFMVEEGKSKIFKLTPKSNPPVTNYKWLKNAELLQTLKSKSIKGVNDKFVVNIATPDDMGNYTIIARNAIGETKYQFFLNVTYGPKLEGPTFVKVSDPQQLADLQCTVKSNPANPSQSITWSRIIPMGSFDDIDNFRTKIAFELKCNEGHWTGKSKESNIKYYSKCSQPSQFKMSSNLAIYYPDKNDIGIYKCTINNGIGDSINKTFEVLIPFTPQILSIPKYSKSASNPGTTISLNCYIRAEPSPTVNWYFGRYNSSIKPNSKYRSELIRIRPGLYLSQLNITNFQRIDHGNYVCKAINTKGSDTTNIIATGTSKPDIPMELKVTNRTTRTVTISWIQGFNGGSDQTFRVRWRMKDSKLFKAEDIAPYNSGSQMVFVIDHGLIPGTEYKVSVNSRNHIHGHSEFTQEIDVRTLYENNQSGTGTNIRPLPDRNSVFHNNTILIIISVSILGFVLIVLNILVIFLWRRKRQRRHTSKLQSRFINPKDLLSGASNGLILSRDDHLRDSNSNFMRSDAVELYPRSSSALDTASQIYHQHQPPMMHPHHLGGGGGSTGGGSSIRGSTHNPGAQVANMHHMRRSIPDDQKTFSSFDTAGSDDVREDLLRRQKEYIYDQYPPTSLPQYIGGNLPIQHHLSSTNSLQGNPSGGSLILAYDPLTNSHYYTTAANLYIATNHQSPGGTMVNNSQTTLLQPLDSIGSSSTTNQNQQLMTVVNLMPNQTKFIPIKQTNHHTGSIHSFNSTGQLMNDSLINNDDGGGSSHGNKETGDTSSINKERRSASLVVQDNTPYRSTARLINPVSLTGSTLINYSGISSPHHTTTPSALQREIYADELRKAQLTNSANLLINQSALFNRQTSLPNSPHQIITQLPQTQQLVFENTDCHNSTTSTLPRPTIINNQSRIPIDLIGSNNNQSNLPIDLIGGVNNNHHHTSSLSRNPQHKYRCTDTNQSSIVTNNSNQPTTSSISNNTPLEFINPSMEDSMTHSQINNESASSNKIENQKLLPRPNLM